MHAGGCIGDFYYVYLLVFKFKQKGILIEDTLSGLIIYQKREAKNEDLLSLRHFISVQIIAS